MSESGTNESVLSGMVGPYEVLEQIGKGTSGVTFRARHTGLGRNVAIKLLNPMLVGKGNSTERFRREARILASLDHPNVLMIHDCGEHEGKLYMVLELVEGASVRDMLTKQGGPLPLDTCHRLMRELLLGLEAAHSKGIVHRDIKPDNLLINEHGTLKIADFGVGRLLDFDPITRVGAVVGTPYYMAPEQCAVPGWSTEVDARSDLYAAGVLFFEVLTGKLPFRSRSLVELVQKKVSEPPPDLSELRADAPKSYSRIANKLLAARPADRYQSAREVLEALTAPDDEKIAKAFLESSEGGTTMRIRPGMLDAALLAAGKAQLERVPRSHSASEARRAPSKPLRLTLCSNDKGNFKVLLRQGKPVSLGRSSQRARLAIPDQRMSRLHCELRLSSGEVWIKDLGSANGTYVNGRRIPTEAVISHGDHLIVGDTKFTIEFEDSGASLPDVAVLKCSRCGGRVRPGSIVDGRAVVLKDEALLICASCALNAPLEERLKADGFVVEELLGSEGRSYTYRARRSSVDEVVTLRVFDLEGEVDSELGKRFRKDARALARLRHPCSVVVYDVRKAASMIYVVMEYTVGEQLLDRVARRGGLPLPEALQILFNVARVCELSESQGLSHQNLSPKSIMITADGRTKLTSFALGGPPAGEQSPPPETLRFVAPEILRGESSADRVRADLYSFGACLHYAVTGTPPFADMADEEYLRCVNSQRLPSFKTTIEGADDHPWLENFIARCLEIDPSARHDSMGALVADLVSVVKQEFLPRFGGSGESLFALLNSDVSGTATSRLASQKRTKGLIAGTFEGDELAEFLQMVGLNQRTGCLEIVTASISGEVYLEKGTLVGGRSGDETGLELVKRLMKTSEGSFEFRSELPPGAQQFKPLSVSSFLLDIMRETDERQR